MSKLEQLPEEVIERIGDLEVEIKELESIIAIKNKIISGLTSFILLHVSDRDQLNTDIFDLEFLEDNKY